MLQISDRALTMIEEVRLLSGAADGEAIAFFRRDGGVGFEVREPAAGEQVVAREGHAVVVVAADLYAPFDGWVLDFDVTAPRGAFTLHRP